MGKPIYLDYHATTLIDLALREAMLPYLDEYFGNPSTTLAYGPPVKATMERARQRKQRNA
jgi:cysteine desulfurase